MTTKLETLPTPDKKSGGAGKPTNHRKPRESRGTLAFSRAQRGKCVATISQMETRSRSTEGRNVAKAPRAGTATRAIRALP